MEKASIFLIVFVSIILNMLAYATDIKYSSTYTGTTTRQSSCVIQLDLKGQVIPATSNLEYNFYYVAPNTKIDFSIYSKTATNNITTANVEWLTLDGYDITSNSTLTSGIGINFFPSDFLKMTIYNYDTVPTTITGNILIRN